MESSIDSVIGSVGRLLSSISVVAKTSVGPASEPDVSGFVDLVRIPISGIAVDDTMRRSFRSGGQSLKRSSECCGGLSAPNGAIGSGIF